MCLLIRGRQKRSGLRRIPPAVSPTEKPLCLKCPQSFCCHLTEAVLPIHVLLTLYTCLMPPPVLFIASEWTKKYFAKGWITVFDTLHAKHTHFSWHSCLELTREWRKHCKQIILVKSRNGIKHKWELFIFVVISTFSFCVTILLFPTWYGLFVRQGLLRTLAEETRQVRWHFYSASFEKRLLSVFWVGS